MKKSKILFTLSIVSSFVFFACFFKNEVNAVKKFVPKTKPSTARTAPRNVSPYIPANVRYRPDKLGLLISFNGFSGLESVSYSFMYNTNGLTQGAGGTITADNNPGETRELLFGTCSGGVCRYDSNLSNASLTLTATLMDGRTAVKRYRIKTYR